jgi:hypothetical protein
MKIRYKNIKPGDEFTHVNQPYRKLNDNLAAHNGEEWIDHRYTGADGRECRRWIRGRYTLEMTPNCQVEVDMSFEDALQQLHE